MSVSPSARLRALALTRETLLASLSDVPDYTKSESWRAQVLEALAEVAVLEALCADMADMIGRLRNYHSDSERERLIPPLLARFADLEEKA